MPEIMKSKVLNAGMFTCHFPSRANIKRLLPIITRKDKGSINTPQFGMLAHQFKRWAVEWDTPPLPILGIVEGELAFCEMHVRPL